MMNRRLLQTIVGGNLALFFLSCSTKEQVVAGKDFQFPAEDSQVAEFYVEPKSEQVTPSLSREVKIPLLKVDATSIYRQMITYITPEEETAAAAAIQTDKIKVYIDFPAGSSTVSPKYGHNEAELDKLRSRLTFLLENRGVQVKGVRLVGYASPDGDTKENERLAGGRAIQFKKYLKNHFKMIDNRLITVDWVGEDWVGLREAIAKSGKPYTAQVLAILDKTSDPESRRKQIAALNKGAVYKDIEKNFFAPLRRMELNVQYESVSLPDKALRVEEVYEHPERLSLQDILQVANLYRPGTEQYREIYEIAAYRFPENKVAQLNAAAASLALGDKESARYFFQQAGNDARALNNLGVLALMDGNLDEAIACFRKALPQNPRQARENIRIVEELQAY